MSVFHNSMLLSPSGAADFDTTLISKSVFLDGTDDRLDSPSFSAQTDPTCFTFATWVQRNKFATSQYLWSAEGDSGEYASINIDADDKLVAFSGSAVFTTTKIFRDIGWYHIICSYKGAANTVLMFVNGIAVSNTKASGNLASDLLPLETAHTQRVGAYFTGATGATRLPLNSYLVQTVFLDGHSIQDSDVAVTDFLDSFAYGTNGSQFGPKANASVAALASAAGDNSFCLDYADSSALGTDTSSDGNDFTPTSMAAANQKSHSPSRVFSIMNTLNLTSNTVVYSKGNLTTSPTSDWSQTTWCKSTMVIPKDKKIYVECRLDVQDGDFAAFGAATNLSVPTATNVGGPGSVTLLGRDKYVNGSNSLTGLGKANATDILQVAIDGSNNKVWLGINNTYGNSGDPANGTNESGTITTSTALGDDIYIVTVQNAAGTITMNFGQDDTFGGTETAAGNTDGNGFGIFKHAPPTGFLALCSANITTPELQGADCFNAVIYEGTGSEQTIGTGETGSKFTALAWIKNRDAADDNIWMDRVIGTGGYLSTTQNDSGTAATAHGDGGSDILTAEAQAVRAFGQRAVTIGTMNEVNTSGESYVLWQWLIGDSATSAGSISTGSPSLSTTGLVADTNHFSIVQYTGNATDGATFAHGLGAPPQCIIIKRRTGAPLNSDWTFYNERTSLALSNTYPHYRIAKDTHSIQAITNDLVQLGNTAASNKNTETHMAYCFRNTPGVFKAGTYLGNGSADGIYVSTGFRPKFVWIFNTTLTGADAERPIIDTARYGFNGATTAGGANGGVVFSDQRAAEEAMNTSLSVNPAIDFLADGFKLRANDSTINTATEYMYICQADIGGGGTLPPIYGR